MALIHFEENFLILIPTPENERKKNEKYKKRCNKQSRGEGGELDVFHHPGAF